MRSTLSNEVRVEGKAWIEDREDSSNDSRKEIPSFISSLTDAVDGVEDVELDNNDGVISEISNTTQISRVHLQLMMQQCKKILPRKRQKRNVCKHLNLVVDFLSCYQCLILKKTMEHPRVRQTNGVTSACGIWYHKAEGEVNNSSNSIESLTNLDITEDGKMLDQGTKDPKKERELPLTMNKPKTQRSKNWSKLKKLILPWISIKGLEKARKFNPREPQLLPATPNQELEKVELRHQMADERKKAEK
ncbi:hypothetical protein T459_13949 [Capsicum annuum]|uniref:Calmodulin-binding domain-containing protein n=1 Tax=Capsicum annuum TaxID=4072 RepID=A0A2G2ZG88_CAPAN|nr:hypothetical protein T459_13949 [Capsicum annuum]